MGICLVLFCGGRTYRNRTAVEIKLSELRAKVGSGLVAVTGHAAGADRMVEVVCEEMGIPYIAVPALWSAHGKSAGPRRNAVMAELPITRVVAFPGGVGTADMVSRARKKGIPVDMVDDGGE